MNEEQKPKTKHVETYAEDMAEAISGGEEGLIKKIIQEQEEQEEEKKKLSPERRRNRFFMIMGSVLVALAFIILAVLAVLYRDAEHVFVPKQFAPVIFTDQTDFLDVSGMNKDQIYALIRGRATSLNISPGQIAGLYLAEDKEVTGFKRFLALSGSNFPGDKTSLVSENFLIGVLGRMDTPDILSGDSVFLILKVRSFLDIFENLRAWEDKMFFDLAGLFGNGVSSETENLLTRDFEDGFIENKNARILYDDVGNIALMYIFADDTSVIITASVDAAKEALERLSAGDIRK